MDAIVFADKSVEPDASRLAEVLGASWPWWQELKQRLQAKHGDLIEEWKFYGQKSGWTLKLLQKKRNLFFFAPREGCFAVAFVFGDKAVAAVEQSGLPADLVNTLRNAKKYVEGRGLRLEVRSPADIENIIRLVDIKVAH